MARPARPRLTKRAIRTRALLIRRVLYRESDCIVTLFTEQMGMVGVIARGLRRSLRRFAGLESMHLLRVGVDTAFGRELGTLTEAQIERPRLGLISSLGAMEAAGRALRWLRTLAPNQTTESGLWLEINALLDALDAPDALNAPDADREAGRFEALLGAAGLRMLDAAGWGLNFGRCVRCDKACPPRARAEVDVAAGGVVCRSCGGGRVTLTAAQRQRMIQACSGDELALAQPGDALLVTTLVEQALTVHGAGRTTERP